MNRTKTDTFDIRLLQQDASPHALARAQNIAGMLLDGNPSESRLQVLDYGCGRGILSMIMSQRVCGVTAVDRSAEALSLLSGDIGKYGIENIRVANCVYSDAEFLQLGTYDLSVSVMTLHHIGDPEGFAWTMAEVTNPGGLVALADLDAEDGSFHGEMDGVHHHGFSRQRFREILESARLSDIELEVVQTIQKNGREFDVLMATGRKN